MYCQYITMSSRRYKSLSISDKKKIIEAVASGEKQKVVAESFAIAPSILKKKMLSVTSDKSRQKRNKLPDHPQLEHCVLQWFVQCRTENILISGTALRE